MKLNPREQQIVELTKHLAQQVVDAPVREQYALGHGFLWGEVTIRRAQANGKIREFKVEEILAYGCLANWSAAQAEVEKIPGVSGTWVNLD